MNKQEFENYVESFMREPGEFTLDEIIDIGAKHKEITPMADRSWESLAIRVGWPGSKESLRAYVNRNIRKLDVLEVSKDFSLSTVDVKKDKGCEDVNVETDYSKYTEEYKQKTLVRDLRNSITRTLRDEARIDALKEALIEAAKSLNELPKVNKDYAENISEKKEAILMLSDLHIGVECNNFYNIYNVNVACARLSKLCADVIRYVKANNVYKLNIVNLGDLIHGIIHVSARVESQLDAASQVMIAGDLLSQFLNQLSSVAPVVTYRSCSDNHSRMIANKNEAIEKENLGRLVDWFLQERLKNTDIQFCNDNIDFSLGKFELLDGRKVMFAHGHNDSINRSFESFIGASKEFIDIGLLGHYHSNKTKSFNGFKIFVNGSIVGTEQYALSKRLFSDPEQKLLIFDNSNIIDININLR